MVNHHCARKGYFRVGELKQLFPNDLRREESLRLVGQVILGIQRLPFWEMLHNRMLEPIDVFSRCRRNRNDFGETVVRAVTIDDREESRFPYEVDLVQNDEG